MVIIHRGEIHHLIKFNLHLASLGFAFMEKFDVPEEKLFTKSLVDRFEWASSVDKEFRF